jgi:hypothetical protein
LQVGEVEDAAGAVALVVIVLLFLAQLLAVALVPKAPPWLQVPRIR